MEMWERAGEAMMVGSEEVNDTQYSISSTIETVLMLGPTTVLRQAVGNNLIFEVEVIDPKEEQGDIQEKDSEVKT